jgi:hypothetical protein
MAGSEPLFCLPAPHSLDYSAGSARPLAEPVLQPPMAVNSKLRNATLIWAFALVRGYAAADCAAPQALEAKLRAHPAPQTYDALGSWFGEHRQFDCAAGPIKPDSSSPPIPPGSPI